MCFACCDVLVKVRHTHGTHTYGRSNKLLRDMLLFPIYPLCPIFLHLFIILLRIPALNQQQDFSPPLHFGGSQGGSSHFSTTVHFGVLVVVVLYIVNMYSILYISCVRGRHPSK